MKINKKAPEGDKLMAIRTTTLKLGGRGGLVE